MVRNIEVWHGTSIIIIIFCITRYACALHFVYNIIIIIIVKLMIIIIFFGVIYTRC